MREESVVPAERVEAASFHVPEKLIDLEGQRFGAWKVLGYGGKDRWLCYCQCGTVAKVSGQELQDGQSASCGCSLSEKERTRAGLNERDVISIRWLYEEDYSQRFLARLYGVTQSAINDIVKRRTWRQI